MSSEMRNGSGIYYYHTGETYAGQWRDNELNGRGVYIFVNGEKYEGEIKHG